MSINLMKYAIAVEDTSTKHMLSDTLEYVFLQ